MYYFASCIIFQVESIDFGDLLSRDMSLEFVQEMLDENPENIRLQMYYVVKACALGVSLSCVCISI